MRTNLVAVVVAALMVGGTAAAQQKGQGAKAAAAQGKTEVTWWGHAGFFVRTPGGAVIAIDPWLGNPKAPQGVQPPETVDAILVTHGHFDHAGSAKELATKTGAQVFGSYELINLMGLPQDKGVGANAGGTFQVKDVTIHFVEAVHSSSYAADDKSPPQYAGAPVGYVLEIANGPTLYHAGDTGVFASMATIAEQFKPTVAMLPIGGHFTMGPSEAAQAARLLKVKSLVPMHYGTFPLLKGTPEELEGQLKKVAAPARVLRLEAGKATAL
ncbi:metal-dependent hydrolase [Archangium lipolyticum]|uniref:metal-dependent hydrolase n=1 Tax=Archangium lipolyticum TaxID=2970465 RepID=UPI002149EC50|nr:metal-dependent hydrolase [Archangium lipolyticum]